MNKINSLKYQRSTTSDCKDKEVKKFGVCGKDSFLMVSHPQCIKCYIDILESTK